MRQQIGSFNHTPAINLNVRYGKRDPVRGKAVKDHFTFFGYREKKINKKLEVVTYCINFVMC